MQSVSLPEPCLFPPLSLVLDVLLYLRIPSEIETFFLKIRRRFTSQQWLRRWQCLFALTRQQHFLLLDFLDQETRKEGELYCMEEVIPSAIIELRKTP